MGAQPGRATVAATVLALSLALAAAALARSGPRLAENRPVEGSASAGGALRIADSRGEKAILEAPALAPGAAVTGKLTIENLGSNGRLALSRSRLLEAARAAGSKLAPALRLRIRDITDGRGAVVYAGPLATMPTLQLGPLSGGESRRYRFVATLPEPGLVDNSLMGVRARFDYRWQLRR
jgi:hypothetical protein